MVLVKPSVDKALVKARSHLKRGETIEAEKLYKAILATFPKNKKAKEGLASLKIYLRSSDNKNAPQEIIENLVSFYNKGQLELVIKKAQEITKNYPETFIVWNILGIAAARTKKFDQAVYAFQRATSIRPEYSEGYYNMGNALKDQGNLEEAVIAYKKAISFKSDYPAAFYNMGRALKNQDKFEEAVKAYKRAIVLKPDYVEAHNNLGNVFREQGSYKEAINAYKKASISKAAGIIRIVGRSTENMLPNFVLKLFNLPRSFSTAIRLPEKVNIPITIEKIATKTSEIGKEVLANST